MALFIANMAFDGGLLDGAKLGIFLASACSAAAGPAVLAWLPVPGDGPRSGRPPTRWMIVKAAISRNVRGVPVGIVSGLRAPPEGPRFVTRYVRRRD